MPWRKKKQEKGRAEILRAILYSVSAVLLIIAAYWYYQQYREADLPSPASEDIKAMEGRQHGSDIPVDNKPMPINGPEAMLVFESRDNQEHKGLSDRTDGQAQKAFDCFNKGDYRCAADNFMELTSKDARVFVGLGVSYYNLGDYERAAQYAEESLKQTDNFMARKILSFIYYSKNDLQGSLINAEKGLLLKKDRDLISLQEKIKREKMAEGSFIKESTLHFAVFYDGYAHRDLGRKVLGMLEDAYNSIGRELNYFPLEPVTVIIYTEKDFYDITQKPGWSGGLYDGKIRIPVRGVSGQEAALKRVLFHEYTHALVHSITRQCPLWVNEGLAEYFTGRYSDRIGQVIPLTSLEDSFPEDKIAVAYKESYSAMRYLIDRYGLLRIKELLSAFSGGKDIAQAFRDVFYISYDEFVSGWGKD